MSLLEKWQSYYEKISKNYYYQKNYFIFKLPSNGKLLKQLWEQKHNNPEFFTQTLRTKLENLIFHSMSLDEKWQSYYEKISKNYYYQKNYFIFQLPFFPCSPDHAETEY